MKLTRKLFCDKYEGAKTLRRKDPIAFEIEFNNWKRRNQKHI